MGAACAGAGAMTQRMAVSASTGILWNIILEESRLTVHSTFLVSGDLLRTLAAHAYPFICC